MLKGFSAKLGQSDAIVLFARIWFRSFVLTSFMISIIMIANIMVAPPLALPARRSFPSPLNFAVDSFLQLECDPALGERHVGQRSRQIWMPQIPLAVMTNGVFKELDRFIETAFPARHSSIERLNVAERHIVVGLAQHGFRRLRNAHRFFPFPLLKQKPAFEHLHHRRHPQML